MVRFGQDSLQHGAPQHPGNRGFTLVEVLIAGVLLTLVMSTVARLNTAAIAASHTLAERRRIEDAINDHIQLIQQSDSILSYDRLPERHRSRSGAQPAACEAPAEYLAMALREQGQMNIDHWQAPSNNNTVQLFHSFGDPSTESTAIQTTYSHDTTNNFVIVTYSFQGPEASIATERRSIELSPHFQSACPPQ